MEIIEIKGNKESKSRYKTILAGLDKNGNYFGAFVTTIDKKNPRSHFGAGNIEVKGTNRKKVMEQILAIISIFPPEHTLHFIDMTESEAKDNG